ncbi:MAG: calcium/sodium antiporter [Lachnospiraceae bacterium]|nr:calcium/sodium antiporter [Lachnospiraceae bacterium]
MLDYVFLIVGFVLLIKGADFFVEGSASVAKKFRIPSMIIGMTIVAMGTSAPECAVSIAAALKGNNTMAISNVVGSNIFNLMVVCGACALFTPLVVKRSTLRQEFPLSILAALLLLTMGKMNLSIGRIDGVILLAVFAVFLVWMVLEAKKARSDTDREEEIAVMTGWQCLLYILVGIAAIVAGGDFVVDSASAIAESFGLSPTLIGLTIVAFGTSLPELVTSLVAAKKGETDMALGNVIGSNIFNILLVLGAAGAISPMEVLMENLIDDVILIGMSAVVWVFAWRRKQISRWHGIIMLAMYGGYMVYICIR